MALTIELARVIRTNLFIKIPKKSIKKYKKNPSSPKCFLRYNVIMIFGKVGNGLFVFGKETEAVNAGEGAERKLLGRGGSMMMTEVTFKLGAVGAIHSHPHEQISYIVQGSFEFDLNGKKQKVEKGDSIYIPSNTLHGVKALEENSVILDIFTPQREDFLL
ncbi:cupin domain-containing protein [Neobacillus dielmonensis]|uniref:cupin domain-containing protein n=1 Tax=Neobacillus dielmonensis TaxID=1347369 RepID=UPI0038738AD2